jgi:glycerophosphoryl diester phosphodiesterase
MNDRFPIESIDIIIRVNTKIVAHRGASFDFPENSFAAFDAACELEVDGIELDLQLSKDEKVLVFHDSFMQKAGRPELKVSDLNCDELRELDVGLWFSEKFKGQKMPLLEEVLERYAEKTTLLLEIKADAHDPRHDLLTQKIMQALEERNLLEKVYLLCFDPRVLQMAYKMNPACRPVFNLDQLDKNDQTLLEIKDKCQAFSLNIDQADEAAVTWVKEQEKLLMFWTVNSEEQIKKAQQKKADYVMTDKPAFLKNVLASS